VLFQRLPEEIKSKDSATHFFLLSARFNGVPFMGPVMPQYIFNSSLFSPSPPTKLLQFHMIRPGSLFRPPRHPSHSSPHKKHLASLEYLSARDFFLDRLGRSGPFCGRLPFGLEISNQRFRSPPPPHRIHLPTLLPAGAPIRSQKNTFLVFSCVKSPGFTVRTCPIDFPLLKHFLENVRCCHRLHL